MRNGTGSKLEKMKLHRTKCASLVKNVLSTALHEDQFYSKKHQDTVTAFLGLLPVIKATGQDLFDSLKICLLDASKLTLSNCFCFTRYGASAMVGVNSSM